MTDSQIEKYMEWGSQRFSTQGLLSPWSGYNTLRPVIVLTNPQTHQIPLSTMLCTAQCLAESTLGGLGMKMKDSNPLISLCHVRFHPEASMIPSASSYYCPHCELRHLKELTVTQEITRGQGFCDRNEGQVPDTYDSGFLFSGMCFKTHTVFLEP